MQEGIKILKVLEQLSEEFKPKRPSAGSYLAGFHYACQVTKDLTETVAPLLETFLNITQPPKKKKSRRTKEGKKRSKCTQKSQKR